MLSLHESELFARARVVRLESSQTTTEHDTVMHTVDFPVTALLSIMGMVEDGATTELAAVGTEAFVEIDAALRTNIAKRSAVCFFEGDVIRVPLEDFQRELQRSPEFSDLVYHAVRARVFTTEQLVLCNVRHSVVQRLARWLLLHAVRGGRDVIPGTHDFIASMLGVRRAGVSEAIADLEKTSAIEHRRNAIEILDADLLAARACECYPISRMAIEEGAA